MCYTLCEFVILIIIIIVDYQSTGKINNQCIGGTIKTYLLPILVSIDMIVYSIIIHGISDVVIVWP